MIANRELSIDDYLAICRRRLKVVLIPSLVAVAAGFVVSFLWTPRYTSQSLLQIEDQVVPARYVKPIITTSVSDRITALQQQVLSRSQLQPMVERLGLAKKGKTVDQVIDDIRDNLTIFAADPNSPSPNSAAAARKRRRPGPGDDVPGFYVTFTADNARDAQQICAEITSMLLKENLEARTQAAQSTTDFLSRQLEQAKHDLDEQDSKLAAFKQKHQGQLPDQVDDNLKILMGLTSRLDATTQTLTRAQQDRDYATALEAREVEVWKSSQASPNLPSLKQQLITLENNLTALQSRYTEFHPDIVRTKNEIAKLQAEVKLDPDESENRTSFDPKDKMEPSEVLRLRHQIHQDDGILARTKEEQDRLQRQIAMYQGRLALSPDVEGSYKQLTRDSLAAHTLYDSLLTHKREAEIQTEMERGQEGEQMTLLNPASLPTSPSFPVRWMFAAGGLAAGAIIGMAISLWLELRDKSIRSEEDVLASLELPTLAAVPWVGDDRGEKKLRRRFSPSFG
jgi:uncharacterized protein involved in exopolysaccharide biosynthesis